MIHYLKLHRIHENGHKCPESSLILLGAIDRVDAHLSGKGSMLVFSGGERMHVAESIIEITEQIDKLSKASDFTYEGIH